MNRRKLSNKQNNVQIYAKYESKCSQHWIKRGQYQRYTSKKANQSLSTSGDQAVDKTSLTAVKVTQNQQLKNRYVEKPPTSLIKNNSDEFYEYRQNFQNAKVQIVTDEKSVCSEQRQKKVELCRNFLEKGYCQFKARCKFAHGIEQLLKNEDLTSTFKTKKCKTFHDHRQCRFGDRCNFKHDDRNLQQIYCFQKKVKNQKRQKILNNYPQLLLQMKGQSRIAKILA